MLLEWTVDSRVAEITVFNFSDIIDYTWVLPKCDKKKFLVKCDAFGELEIRCFSQHITKNTRNLVIQICSVLNF